jgi:tyrosyl-tRNA synthetase
MFLPPQEQLEIVTKGCVDVLPKGELLEKLTLSYNQKRPLKIKLGVDPTGTDIHLGHLVVLFRLKAFQDCGHEVVFLIGDHTGMIGDPTGRSSTRSMLTHEELMQNAQTYKNQIYKILDKEKTKFQYNSEWLSKLTFKDMIEITSQMTVAQLIERDDFSKRFKNNEPISVVEFLYPLMQGYDSVAMKCDVELGGQDQLFNLLVGRTLQKYYNIPAQVVMTVPLLEGTDGIRKMSKSFGNAIGVDESSKDIFGKIMSIPDSLMWSYFELLTSYSLKEIENLKKEQKEGKNPRDIKLLLAQTIVAQLKGENEALTSKREFLSVFSDRLSIPLDTKQIRLSQDTLLVEVALKENLVQSKSEIKRLITQGAVTLNKEKVNNEHFMLKKGEEMILKIGKTRFLKIIV